MQPGLLKNPRQQAGQGPQQGMQQPTAAPQQAGTPADAALGAGQVGAEEQSHPAFEAATQFIAAALYDKGAANAMADAFTKAPDPAQALADMAYDLAAAADEKTKGAVPDEFLVLLGATALNEVAEVGKTAGVDIQPEVIAGAFKQMTLRYVSEMGFDVSQLQAAMDQADPAEVARFAEQMPAGEAMQ